MIELPQIFAFYSFKGGVGRSMALLNLAYALVAKGRNVLVLDMDLEAPGLSGFMSRQNEIAGFARHDMVDLLLWAKQTAQQVSEDDPLDPNSLPPLSDYAVRVLPEKLESLPDRSWDLGRLDVIPIDETRDYYRRMSEVAVAGMDRPTLLRVGSLLRSWLKSRRIPLHVPDYYGPVPDEDRSAPYDYVLVDSRTGITEVGGLCIGPLSDQLVVFCGLNDQNVEGTRPFLTEVGVLKPSSDAASPLGKPTLFVASPVPNGEMTIKSERLKRLSAALGPFQPKLFELSYHPQMALMETIFVRDYPEERLAREYHSLLGPLLARAENTSDFDPAMFFNSTSTKATLTDRTRKSVRTLLRSASLRDSAPMLFAALVGNRNLETVTEDVDFQLLDRICRAVAFGDTPIQFSALGLWSDVLSQWGLRPSDPALAARRFEEAIHRIDRIIDSPKTSPSGRAKALVNRGVRFGQQGNPEREIADYTAVIEMPDAPAEQKANALGNRSWNSFVAGQIREAIADARQAVRLDPKNVNALGNLAISLLVDHQTNDAFAAYEPAIELAKVEDLADFEKDLRDAIAKHGALPGADEVRARIKLRTGSLQATTATE